MTNFAIGYAKSYNEKFTYTFFNSFKEAKNYVATMYSNKRIFNVETDGRTTFLVTPIF